MWKYLVGNVTDVLRKLPSESIQCCVTSPPYWGLRVYAGEQEVIWGGHAECSHVWGPVGRVHKGGPAGASQCSVGRDQTARDAARELPTGRFCQYCNAWKGAFGLEPTPELYVEHTILILREIRRVLRTDGTVWWNIGDCYAGSGKGGNNPQYQRRHTQFGQKVRKETLGPVYKVPPGLKPKDLVMIPFRVALAAQKDGWYVRSDIIWNKTNPMPENVADRPTKCHEYIFLFTKSAKYYFDAEAVKEKLETKDWHPAQGQNHHGPESGDPKWSMKARAGGGQLGTSAGRNIRSVWTLSSDPYPEAHFATFPPEIPIRCIKAGTSERGCCPSCGAPWERILERLPNPSIPKYNAIRKSVGFDTGACRNADEEYVDNLHRNGGGVYSSVKTIGWKPACACPREDKTPTRPSIVLDPFAGSGTTLQAARGLGRSAIGIDISQEYKKLAEKRAKLTVRDVLEEATRMEARY